MKPYANLLTAMALALMGTPPTSLWAEAPTPAASDVDWSGLHQLLAERVTVEVNDTPLEHVAASLSRQLGVRVMIDETALDDLGIGADEPLTTSMREVTLRAFLEEGLAQLELSWCFRNELLVITTEEEAETKLVTRVYPIGDFLAVERSLRAGRYGGPVDGLLDTIVSTIAAETWAENGGGEAEVRPLLAAQALVISQTQQVHLEIEQLLHDLRAVGRRQGLSLYAPSGDSAEAPRQVARRTYLAPSAPAAMARVYEE
ncbi:hypothetical protein KOR34_20430 [Posidoniimonas corsicana]|uniref:Uncharacterized protein n=1 Tax=Posidoniimonas corsicana TaxID=1938618 RepID=A0A5C5VEL8_9BACT|nr:hypothetical protein [Posidoniimonas corsicana]TWT37096.1 hypothetical protein KOR34_20430 [Posidoniimonas corsicana]